MDRFGLGYYYSRSLEPDTMVLVMEDGKNILGLSMILIGSGSLVIETLTRNALHAVPGAGRAMLNCIEECIAGQLQLHEIRLESLHREKLLQFYERSGFVQYREAYLDREWGVLHPMRKRIVTWGA